MNPKAKNNLLIEAMPDETLVYDLDRHRAHCLNPSAALLLASADGHRSLVDLTMMVDEAFPEPTSEEAVRIGLDRLQRARLLEWSGEAGTGEAAGVEALEASAARTSRRKAIRQMVTLGLVLPAVMTVVSPLTAQGTGISVSDCKTTQDIGNCCINKKRCAIAGGSIGCKGARC